MINRQLSSLVIEMLRYYPIVTLTGPRQSGKTTLLRNLLPEWTYVSLEDPESRSFASEDPRGFLSTYDSHVILDEAQQCPSLFSYLQTHTDIEGSTGQYILSGSHNFLLLKQITQSLAGRTAILRLLPLSHEELSQAGLLPKSINEEIFTGGYPRIYDKGIPPTVFYANYVETYVQRDVRSLENIGNLGLFEKFLRLCAGRIGQILNVSSLANDVGISATTATRWLSVLEQSYIIHRLEPDCKSFSKRITKAPKIYFADTGLACYLSGIRQPDQLEYHHMRGNLFENLVLNRFRASRLNSGETPDFTFWRDKNGLEIDLLVNFVSSTGVPLINAWEIKSGETASISYFDNLAKWSPLVGDQLCMRGVIYAGTERRHTTKGVLLPYRGLDINALQGET